MGVVRVHVAVPNNTSAYMLKSRILNALSSSELLGKTFYDADYFHIARMVDDYHAYRPVDNAESINDYMNHRQNFKWWMFELDEKVHNVSGNEDWSYMYLYISKKVLSNGTKMFTNVAPSSMRFFFSFLFSFLLSKYTQTSQSVS